MRQAALLAFPEYTKSFESFLDFFYLDLRRLVTIGAGNLADPLAILPALTFVRPDLSLATDSEVHAAWLIVKTDRTLNPSKGGSQYRKLTTIRATKESLEKLVESKRAANELLLRKAFPAWEQWPACSQMAALSMTWAYGAAFTRSWPKFTAACLAQDWIAAAEESKASVAELARQNTSFKRRNATQVALFNHAAKGGDPEELMSVNEALMEAVQEGVVIASLGGKTLTPEEYEAAMEKHSEEIVYGVPS